MINDVMGRTLVVGDIHGGLKALKAVLNKAKVTPADHLIFLGDYVDGWSDSVATVQFLIDLQQQQKCTFIRGNHDDLVHQHLLGKSLNEAWIKHGGKASKDGYKKCTVGEREMHITFYERLKDYYIDDCNRMYCHAGFQNQRGPDAEWYSTAFYWDRTLWEMACAMDKSISLDSPFYPKRLKLYKEIYIGHTPVTRLGLTTPVEMANVWNIDTGAAFMGPITILDVDSKKYWQSEAVWEYYPMERGRNALSYHEKQAVNV